MNEDAFLKIVLFGILYTQIVANEHLQEFKPFFIRSMVGDGGGTNERKKLVEK